MKLSLKLTACTALLVATQSILVSCKEEPPAASPPKQDAANLPQASTIGILEGTIGDGMFSAALNTRDSTITIEEWDGIPNSSSQRDSSELSLEAFLLGPERWIGPPRLVTIAHHIDSLSFTLRFAGRLAVDEKLTALPGCELNISHRPLVPATAGSWTTTQEVTLPRYDIVFQVTSYDEPSKAITGVVKGKLIDPAKPASDSFDIHLTLTSAAPPAPVNEPEPEPRIPADHLIIDTTPPAEASDVDSSADEQPQPDASPDPQSPPAEATPAVEEAVEVRPAIPYTPDDGNE